MNRARDKGNKEGLDEVKKKTALLTDVWMIRSLMPGLRVGILTTEDIIDMEPVGPTAELGVAIDVRKDDPYAASRW